MLQSTLKRHLRYGSTSGSLALRSRTFITAPDVIPVYKVIPPLSESLHPFDLVCHMLEYIHIEADVPYYGAIMIGTLAVRVCLFPIAVKLLKHSTKMQLAGPELERLRVLMNQSVNEPLEVKAEIVKDMKDTYAKYQVNPVAGMGLAFCQMPVFLSMFFGLQRMAEYFPAFAVGGIEPFLNLSTADPTCILPIINGLTFLVVTESNPELDKTAQGKNLRIAFRVMALGMPVVTAYFAKGVLVYWITNNCITAVQGVVLRNPAIRHMLKFPVASQFPPTSLKVPSSSNQSVKK